MTNKALLNNIDHANLRVTAKHGPAYGDSVHQALIFPTEFADVQREYPILFCRDDSTQSLQSVALLGLEENENLFLDDAGWRARYVPASMARGPFSIALHRNKGSDTPEPMIHVDLDDPRIDENEGERLFLPHGGNSPYLERVSEALQRIHRGAEIATSMFDAFSETDLIAPVRLELMLSETEKYNIVDYFSISEERLRALDGAALERLNKGGFLQMAFWAVSSLGAMSRLIELKKRKRAQSLNS